jgi:excisionase family DNA binding protein
MLTVDEISARLRVTKKTVFNLVRSGELAAIKTSGAPNAPLRITEESFAAYIERNRVVPATEAS